MKCSVLDCGNKMRFKFPSNPALKEKWLRAIRRSNFLPRSCHGLCIEHFNPNDVIRESYRDGYKLQNLRLKRGAVPKMFSWQDENVAENIKIEIVEEHYLDESNLQSNTAVEEEQQQNHQDTEVANEYLYLNDAALVYTTGTSNERTPSPSEFLNNSAEIADDDDVEFILPDNMNSNIQCDLDVYEEKIHNDAARTETSEPRDCSKNILQNNDKKDVRSISSQTVAAPRYTITDFKNKPKSLLHFTGLESYEKFLTVLYSLGPRVYNLKYARTNVGNLDKPDQLFLVLWKLRRYPNDIELSEHFNIPEVAVGNIFITWITFMSETWSLVDLWPSRKLIDFYMPETFKRNYPTARVIVDGTEIKTEAPSNPRQKQSSFNTYENTTTMEILIGGSSGGLVSYASSAYGGSASDRQIVERSDLFKKCQSGDMIIGDEGFLVQDLLAPYNVTVATPTPLVSGTIPRKTVTEDCKLSKHSVYIERLIGLLKTFTILSKELNHYCIPLSSEIVGVCVMLTNFKENIMKAGI